MPHKNDYSVVAFFENEKPKKWNFVHRLSPFSQFLTNKHKDWLYMNVYDRRTRKFLKRFNKGNIIPDFL